MAPLMRVYLVILLGLSLVLGGEERPKLDIAPALDELIGRAYEGDVISQFTLAGLYEERGAATNAFRWYRITAELGYPRGQFKTGYYFATGQGIGRDFVKAVDWFERAAEHGVVEAQYNLGVSYEKGLGTSQSFLEALKWYRRAADQGDPHAQKALGVFYERGLAVAKDPVEAFKWYSVASGNGSEEAGRLRDLIQKNLKPLQIVEGKNRATNFKPVAEPAPALPARVPVPKTVGEPKAKPKDFLD